MNNKKAKSCRKAVRNMGRDPRDAAIMQVKGYMVGAFLGRPGAPFLGQRILAKTCGRHLLKSLKRAVLRGAVA